MSKTLMIAVTVALLLPLGCSEQLPEAIHLPSKSYHYTAIDFATLQ